ncbi:MAG TPA: methyltransferase domain-containing protein, partial [Saprospiraceae bacterium]|nr:methyltransferase domain-containing protein [Saprospiraceae bacterium]
MTDSAKQEKFLQCSRNLTRVVIEIGCGPKKKDQAYIGIDSVDLPGVDIVHNLEDGLPFIPENSVDEVTSAHTLEHIANFEGLMKDIHRILKKDGIHSVVVPHWSNPHYYSDFTHKRFFGLYTFDYFTPQSMQTLQRKVPDFYTDFHFQVTERRLKFKVSPSPRNWFNFLIARPLFNSSD